MANFAVNTSDELAARGKELLNKYLIAGEKQGDALSRIFDVAEHALDSNQLTMEGVNADELDATLAHLRSIYVGAVSGRQELVEAHQREVTELKVRHEQTEADLREKIQTAEEAKKLAEDAVITDKKEMEQARAELEQLHEAQSKNDKLLAAVEAERDRLQVELEDSKKKAGQADALQARVAELEAECNRLQLETEKKLLEQQREHQSEIQALIKEHTEAYLALMSAKPAPQEGN